MTADGTGSGVKRHEPAERGFDTRYTLMTKVSVDSRFVDHRRPVRLCDPCYNAYMKWSGSKDGIRDISNAQLFAFSARAQGAKFVKPESLPSTYSPDGEEDAARLPTMSELLGAPMPDSPPAMLPMLPSSRGTHTSALIPGAARPPPPTLLLGPQAVQRGVGASAAGAVADSYYFYN